MLLVGADLYSLWRNQSSSFGPFRSGPQDKQKKQLYVMPMRYPGLSMTQLCPLFTGNPWGPSEMCDAVETRRHCLGP